MAQGKTWVFTINNFTEQDKEWIQGLEVNRITVSSEEGESGTPHLQGAVTFKRQYTLKQLKKLHTTAHWELAKAKQDFNYCKKAGSTVIRDECYKQQGKRTDIEVIREELEAGADMKQVLKKARSMQAVSFAKVWMAEMEEHLPKGTPIEIYWYYGCSGTGKTKAVLDECSPFIPQSYKWWDGYSGQDAVLLDDLRPEWCPPSQLLRLLDNYRYQYRVEVKGGMRPLVATKIYITTPWHPRDFWKDNNEDPLQLLRRIKKLVWYRADGAWEQPRV